MKCAGAPLKYTFITDDYLSRRGQRSKAEVVYNSNNKALFSVPIVSEKVRMLFQERGIQVNYERVLKAIDPGKRIATFSTPTGTEEQGYDFIHVIPPMRAPEPIRNSPLPWQTSPWAAEGWLEVDKGTLRLRFPHIFFTRPGPGSVVAARFHSARSIPVTRRPIRAMAEARGAAIRA